MKMSYDDWAYICNYKEKHTLKKLTCTFEGTPINGGFHITSKIKLPLYVILFIPVHIILFFVFAWAEGIKNFTIQSRIVDSYHISKYQTAYDKIKKVIYNKREE